MSADKKILRQQLLTARLAISRKEADAASPRLAEQLLTIIPVSKIVAGYVAMRGEIDLALALDELRKRGNKIALPAICEGSRILKFREYNKDSPLIYGKHSTSCPADSCPEVIPEVIITPLLGFDINGNRLGYGGGYYDATISSLRKNNPDILVIGVAYDLQRLENIASEAHDEVMDMLVTESGIIK